MRKLGAGTKLSLSKNLSAVVKGRSADGQRLVLELHSQSAECTVESAMVNDALMPIPPYIRAGRADAHDRAQYQTVFAKHPGSVAAPTAGLHFTEALLTVLGGAGIGHCFVTLHVGPASFLPIRNGNISSHKMLPERYHIPESTRRKIAETKTRGGRVVAVGTTTVRALESEASTPASTGGDYPENLAATNLFITPGHVFRSIDALITNFHQPGSTHLLMVAAFIGEAQTQAVYAHALGADYRFLSYGDAMLLERE